jgi:hypothetical protein
MLAVVSGTQPGLQPDAPVSAVTTLSPELAVKIYLASTYTTVGDGSWSD